MERVSIEGSKTKSKVISSPIKKDGDNPVNQSKLEVITLTRFGFTCDWLKNWRENCEPITE